MNSFESNLQNFFVNDFGDRYLYVVNRNAFNRVGSDSLYSSFYDEKLFDDFQLHIFIGTDSGILPNYVAKCGIPAGSRYIFIELPEVLEILSRDSVLEKLPPEISVTTLDLFNELPEEYQISNYAFLDAVHVHESIGSRDANLTEYRDLTWNVNQLVDDEIYKIMTSANNLPFILCQLENLAENQICFSETLQNAFSGRTAVILAGGPSLNEALPWVRKNSDRLLVIAVSRICRTLREEGIIPHIIVSVDPTILSFEISREMLLLANSPNPPLFISSFHVTPLLAGQWPGEHLYTGPLFPWRTPLNIDSLRYNGPTVSNYAISLSMHMGCTTIILAGVDLCYSAEGQTHAAGSNESKVGPDLGQMSARIETYGGWHAESSQSFITSIRILELQAREITEKGIRICNCSPNAAKVPFIDHIALEEIELPDCDITPSAVIRRHLPESTNVKRLAHYRRVKKEIDRARSKFQEILNLSREALKCTDGLFGRNGMKRDFRHKIRMDKIERRLDRSFGSFSTLVKQCGTRKFFISLKTTMADEMTDEQLENATREYYEAYVAGTEYLIHQMDEIAQRIDARIEEIKTSPDFGKLLAQWEKDKQFGRVHVWRNRNPDKIQKLSDAEQDTVKRFEKEFTHVMTEERTSHIAHIEKQHDVKHTRSKALLLYERREITELEGMAKGLAAHPDPDNAFPYLQFVSGLLAELRDEPAQAIDHYQQLFTEMHQQLTEDALLQVAKLTIAQNDTENALLAVECLVGISPTYLPAYAELLKTIGRFEDAFMAYNHYVGLFPDDAGALVSLGMLCREAGLAHEAEELFQRALAKDPMNGAALRMCGELYINSRCTSNGGLAGSQPKSQVSSI